MPRTLRACPTRRVSTRSCSSFARCNNSPNVTASASSRRSPVCCTPCSQKRDTSVVASVSRPRCLFDQFLPLQIAAQESELRVFDRRKLSRLVYGGRAGGDRAEHPLDAAGD